MENLDERKLSPEMEGVKPIAVALGSLIRKKPTEVINHLEELAGMDEEIKKKVLERLQDEKFTNQLMQDPDIQYAREIDNTGALIHCMISKMRWDGTSGDMFDFPVEYILFYNILQFCLDLIFLFPPYF